MKKQERKKLSLEKLRIARINPGTMSAIHGGSSIPTSVEECPHTGMTVCIDPP